MNWPQELKISISDEEKAKENREEEEVERIKE